VVHERVAAVMADMVVVEYKLDRNVTNEEKYPSGTFISISGRIYYGKVN
jgi:hypothetical protein